MASGRVWTGEQALERGLVDEIGGLHEAISYAAVLAKLEDYKIQEYPKKKTPIESIFEDLGMSAKQTSLEKELGSFYPYYKELKNIENMQGVIQARMPFDLNIK